ncbi:MAG: FAD-dependent oxidoreductase [Dehalococcoidia bacterium]
MDSAPRIVVIGGTACGPKAASRARRCNPKAQITVIEQDKLISYAGCNLPFYISSTISERQSLLKRDPSDFKNVMDIHVMTETQATSINRDRHQVETMNLKTGQQTTLDYDKLVLATGATPVVPPLEGRDLKGIFTLKRVEDADAIVGSISSAEKPKNAVIVGAGLIGIETAEALVHKGISVAIVEALDWVLPALLDSEMAALLARHLEANGINLLLGQKVAGFEGDGDGKVRHVLTEKSKVQADLVLLAIGVRPEVKLARDAGLTLGATGAIAVNEYLQTSDPDIYAGGDGVENTTLITGNKVYAPMGSTANKHGRIIGTNVTGGHESFPGITSTAAVKAFEFNIGRTGITEREARETGADVVTALVPAPDRVGDYPGSQPIIVKLVAERESQAILGGQVIGTGDAIKRTDVLATAITFGCKAENLSNLDLGYSPPYNSAMDPLHHAANVIMNKSSGLAKAVSPAEVKSKIDNGDDLILLDVRSPDEWKEERIEARQVKNIPQESLGTRVQELDDKKEIITICRSSVRAYQAQRTLEGLGFKDVKFMDGSLLAWPYETVSGDRKEEKW